jgi:hypothetical protein
MKSDFPRSAGVVSSDATILTGTTLINRALNNRAVPSADDAL